MEHSHASNGSTTIIAAYGEVLWDLLPSGPAVLGGAPLNFAYRVASLGYRGAMISKVGDDSFGTRALDQMKALGMETAYIQQTSEQPTGTVKIVLDEQKNPDYTILPNVAYDTIRPTPELTDLMNKAECICFGSLAQRSPQSRETLQTLLDAFAGTYALYDINLRKDCYTKAIITASLERSQILKLNDGEMREMAAMYDLSAESVPAFLEGLFRKTPLRYGVVTLGERGAFAASNDGELVYAPAYRVELVDPCGSGDAFTAGFLHSLLSGKSLRDACRFGNALGAMVAEQRGATQSIRHEAIEPFMQQHQTIAVEPQFKEFVM